MNMVRVLLVVCALICFLCSCTKRDDASLGRLLPGEYLLLEDSTPARSARRFRANSPAGRKSIQLKADGIVSFANICCRDVALDSEFHKSSDMLPVNGTWSLKPDRVLRLNYVIDGVIYDHSARIVSSAGRLEIWFNVGDPDDWVWKRFRKQADD